MTFAAALARIAASATARALAVPLVPAVFALASSHLTHDIRMAAGGTAVDHGFAAHLLAWSLWLGLLWAAFALRAALVRALGRGLALRGAIEAACCGLYAWTSLELTFALMSRTFGAPELPGDLSIELMRPMMLARSAGMYVFASFVLAFVQGARERRRNEAATRELRLRHETLERQLSETRLAALEAQLQPHFLFNALHAIGGLILADDKLRAHRALASLSTLLRRSLQHGQKLESSLGAELDLLKEYIDLERLRFGDRMRFEVDVPGELREASVPSLILLPLVENAVTHGLEPLAGGGRIEVAASERDGELSVTVTDDGAGPRAPRRNSTGIGLRNTSERLEALHGDAAGVTVEATAPRGTRVTLRLPLERASLQEVRA